MEILVKHGADVNAVNDKNETALTWAKKKGIQMNSNYDEIEYINNSSSGNRSSEKLLVNHGARIN